MVPATSLIGTASPPLGSGGSCGAPVSGSRRPAKAYFQSSLRRAALADIRDGSGRRGGSIGQPAAPGKELPVGHLRAARELIGDRPDRRLRQQPRRRGTAARRPRRRARRARRPRPATRPRAPRRAAARDAPSRHCPSRQRQVVDELVLDADLGAEHAHGARVQAGDDDAMRRRPLRCPACLSASRQARSPSGT